MALSLPDVSQNACYFSPTSAQTFLTPTFHEHPEARACISPRELSKICGSVNLDCVSVFVDLVRGWFRRSIVMDTPVSRTKCQVSVKVCIKRRCVTMSHEWINLAVALSQCCSLLLLVAFFLLFFLCVVVSFSQVLGICSELVTGMSCGYHSGLGLKFVKALGPSGSNRSLSFFGSVERYRCTGCLFKDDWSRLGDATQPLCRGSGRGSLRWRMSSVKPKPTRCLGWDSGQGGKSAATHSRGLAWRGADRSRTHCRLSRLRHCRDYHSRREGGPLYFPSSSGSVFVSPRSFSFSFCFSLSLFLSFTLSLFHSFTLSLFHSFSFSLSLSLSLTL